MKGVFSLIIMMGAIFSAYSQTDLNIKQANKLAELPLHCISTEYPNKLGQVIGSKDDLGEPAQLHPAFYGCFDWHSAVHGHWSLVRLLNLYPDLDKSALAIDGLKTHLSKENIKGEIAYFGRPHSGTYERMYGWAWLLKLTTELKVSEDPEINQLLENIKPLASLIANKVKEFLPNLNYPIRVGTHTNTAFAMCMIYDYALAFNDVELQQVIADRAKDYYLDDKNCPIEWEPSGYDFLSPCLEEADLMRRILPAREFKNWLKDFLPEIMLHKFSLSPGVVLDRTDGHLVHLDGLNFSRAWCLKGIVETLPELSHLIPIAEMHIRYSLPNLVGDSYEGGHWLASFALLAQSVK